MALEIKQTLRLSQQLVITPQLQQAIKLLQLSRFELQNLIQHELLENPVLEENLEEPSAEEKEEVSVTEPMNLTHESHDKEQRMDEVGTKEGDLKEPTNFDWENYLGTYNAPGDDFSAGERGTSEEMPSYENRITPTLTLQDHLLWQLHLSDMTPQEVEIAKEIIGAVNEEGYFKGDLSEIAKKNQCSVELVEAILSEVQQFDPTGVAARDLKECLRLQIRPFGKEALLLARLIENHLEDLEKRNYPAITKDLGIGKEKLKELSHILSTLEPKPGRPFSGENPQYIVPDVHVQKIGDDYVVLLNDDGLPKLQISSYYRNALFQDGPAANPAKEFIQDKLRAAMWLIRSIHQRQRTLYRVTKSIVKFQRDFLEHGVSHLKPLVLRDVAEDIQMHESTISRVTTNKFVQTPRGLFELKFFFNSRVPSNSQVGITSEAVKDSIKRMIDEENAREPFSDQQIADKLKEKEIFISRRTVAKYREVMGLSPSFRRRQVW